MTLRHISAVLALAAALASGAAASTQAKKHARRHAAAAAAAPAAAASPAVAPAPAEAASQAAGAGFGVAESITGKIQMVVADQSLVVVTGPNDVPYDLKITPKTVIVVGEKRGTIESLASQVGKTASVGFVPQRDGNYAERVEITG
ncbi:MAG TPA: hypothetical protein VGS20_17615 [Candidatus Acidoferrales bacterium]|nr:hypothetical protein [Candidatus Acidoferrales bacterium]